MFPKFADLLQKNALRTQITMPFYLFFAIMSVWTLRLNIEDKNKT
jgi:hypothetical protein